MLYLALRFTFTKLLLFKATIKLILSVCQSVPALDQTQSVTEPTPEFQVEPLVELILRAEADAAAVPKVILGTVAESALLSKQSQQLMFPQILKQSLL